MIAAGSSIRQEDGRLWAIALLLSLLMNAILFGLAGFAVLQTEMLRRPAVTPPADKAASSSVLIFPEAGEAPSTAKFVTRGKRQFARTSSDQAESSPTTPDFFGERNTQATSDRAPDPTAPDLPSQAGENRQDFETTQSDYQEGRMTPTSPAAEISEPSVAMSLESEIPPPANAVGDTATKSTSANSASSTRAEPLFQGSSPVDVNVGKRMEETPRATPEPVSKKILNPPPEEKSTPSPKTIAPKLPADPAFSGNQRKAAIVGSISRTGTSALNVTDSPLGRYQAVISRAVELEWQRNCVRHRDFITPGFLTVRFFVEPGGKVRTVQFVGEMETGEVQKGFTLNAIRNAEIPPMPAAVKREFAKEPLELIFNFYF